MFRLLPERLLWGLVGVVRRLFSSVDLPSSFSLGRLTETEDDGSEYRDFKRSDTLLLLRSLRTYFKI